MVDRGFLDDWDVVDVTIRDEGVPAAEAVFTMGSWINEGHIGAGLSATHLPAVVTPRAEESFAATAHLNPFSLFFPANMARVMLVVAGAKAAARRAHDAAADERRGAAGFEP